FVGVGAESEVACDEDVVAFAERVGDVPGLLVEDDDSVVDGAGVFPSAGGVVESSVVDGDGEAGVFVAGFAGAVFGVAGEVALDGDRDSGGHGVSFLLVTPGWVSLAWAWVVHVSHSCSLVAPVQVRGLVGLCPVLQPPP